MKSKFGMRKFKRKVIKPKYPYINYKEDYGQIDLQVNVFAVKV
jgi:hypothetical protein